MLYLAAITFGIVLALVLGLYWFFIERVESQERAELKKRMVPSTPKPRRRLLLDSQNAEQEERNPAVVLIGRATAPLQRRLATAGMTISAPAFLMMAIWIAALAFAVLWLGTGSLVAGAAGGALTLYLPFPIVNFKASSRAWRFEEQFPEAVDLIARALRAGHAFPTAIGMVASEVPNPVGGEFKKLHDQQNFGMSMPDALRAFADRVPVLDARFFVTAVLTQREAGGNLAGVLDNLAAVVRERFKVKRQVRVVSAHGRMTGLILSAMPPVLALLLTMVSPRQMLPLIEDPLGLWFLGVAVVLQLIGMAVMRRIVNVEF